MSFAGLEWWPVEPSSPLVSNESTAPLSPKEAAGRESVKFIKSGQVVGLGTGSTVEWFLVALAERIQKEGLEVRGVPTSTATAERAKDLGIPISSLEQDPVLDVTVDGADEVDPAFRLIKGGGGALLREKIVANSAQKVVIVIGAGKKVETLGSTFLLPVEVIPFGHQVTELQIADIGCQPFLRTLENGEAFITDNGNYIFDCQFDGGIENPEEAHSLLSQLPGVAENGIFLDLCDVVVEGLEGGETVVEEK